jgi:HJR/Mrr/RecB family endonuclease
MAMDASWDVSLTGWRLKITDTIGLSISSGQQGDDPGSADARALGLVLKELIDDGQAIPDGDGIRMSHDHVSAMPEVDQQFLQMPPQYPFDIYLDTQGTFTDPGMVYLLEFCEHRDGKRIRVERTGCLIRCEEGPSYILSSEQYALCESVDKFNALPRSQKRLADNLTEFAAIKDMAVRAVASLHSFLQSEDIRSPEGIRVDLMQLDDGAIALLPELVGLEDDEQRSFQQAFAKFSKVREVYVLDSANSGKLRVALTLEQRRELGKVKRVQRVSGDLKTALLERPDDLFDSSVVDLDSFSQRVIAIGEYTPRFCPFVSPYKSEWLPGILVEDGNERHRLVIRAQEELSRLEDAIKAATTHGNSEVEYEGHRIPMAVARNIAAVAADQLANPSEPVAKNRETANVLIIEENIEDVGSREEQPPATDDTFTHRYGRPPGLGNDYKVMSHQREGIAWLESLDEDGYSGALLADDMGLGKTLQILAFLDWSRHFQNTTGRPYLIVAPLSLLTNWQDEYRKFFASEHRMPIVVVQGRTPDHLAFQPNPHTPTLVLTTYETLRSRQLELAAIDWAATVLDECQRVKTPGTLVTNAAKALKSSFRVAMTGTPVENTLADLWCVMDYAVPGVLGSLKGFASEYQRPGDRHGEDLAALGERLRLRISPHFKRRLKGDVLDSLPEKHEHVLQKPMPPEQLSRYVEAIRESERSDGKRGALDAIRLIREISDHPFLPDFQTETYDSGALVSTSAKLRATVEILESIQQRQEKVILFTERKKTQRMLVQVMRDVYGLDVSVVNGDVSAASARLDAIRRFEEHTGFNAIVLSPLAVGVGLNITGANHVVHYSRHWNPAKEDQATDRVYRIGQTRPVHVYYPMAVTDGFKAFDVILDELLRTKRALSAGVLFPTEAAEVELATLFDQVMQTEAGQGAGVPMQMDDVDALTPSLFEAFVCLLWQRQGYTVSLTPQSADKGADVVALGADTNLLIQIKHSRGGNVGDAAVGEILKSRGYYSKMFGAEFELAIATNVGITGPAVQSAEYSNVRTYVRADIERLAQRYGVTLAEVRGMDAQRMPHSEAVP